MKNLLNRVCRQDALLQSPAGIIDGTEIYTSTLVRVRLIRRVAVRDQNPPGKVINQTEILVAPPAIPTEDDRITINGRTYELAGVAAYYDFDGNFCGTRCTVIQ